MTRAETIALLTTTSLAITGWLATHIDERITATPLLEFRTDYASVDGAGVVEVELTNLNRKSSYRNLDVLATAARGGTIMGVTVVPVEPASEGEDEPRRDAGSASFQIPNLMPMGAVRAFVKYGGRAPRFRITSIDQPILVIRPSLETWLARHELPILVALIPLAIAFAALSVWFSARIAPSVSEAEA